MFASSGTTGLHAQALLVTFFTVVEPVVVITRKQTVIDSLRISKKSKRKDDIVDNGKVFTTDLWLLSFWSRRLNVSSTFGYRFLHI